MRKNHPIILQVAKEFNIKPEVVINIFHSEFRFIKDKIKEIPIKDIENEEQFSSLRSSFNLPGLGKLYTTFKIIKGIRDKFTYLKNKKNGDCNKSN